MRTFEGAVSWLEGVKDQKPACSNGKANGVGFKTFMKQLKMSIIWRWERSSIIGLINI